MTPDSPPLYTVAPLLLTAYVGLGLESDHTMTPSVWFGIAAARILRKVSPCRLTFMRVHTCMQWSSVHVGSAFVLQAVSIP